MGLDHDDEDWRGIERDAALIQMKTSSEWFAYWTKELRVELEWSHSDLAKVAIDAGGSNISPGLLRRIEDHESDPALSLVMPIALALGVSPLSMLVGFYPKDQVYTNIVDWDDDEFFHGTTEASTDVARWWVGLPADHWHSSPAEFQKEHGRTAGIRSWVVGDLVPARDVAEQRVRVKYLLEVLDTNEIGLPAWSDEYGIGR